jgi:hypothetical protein
MEQGSNLYLAIKMLHVLSAIVGFGAVMLNMLYGKKSQENQGPGGLAIFDANFYVSHKSDVLRYLVFVFGAIMVAGKGYPNFTTGWVMGAMAIYLVALGVSHGVMFPTLKKMRANLAELVAMGPPPEGAMASGPPPQVAVVEALGKRVAIAGIYLNLSVVAVLFLMIFKPGA